MKPDDTEARPPKSENDLRYWLENMVWHHQYSLEEIAWVTGFPETNLVPIMESLGITAVNRPPLELESRVKALPYPGGRHPRTGFLDGAVNPQRETKISVFAPWDNNSYVVVDVPEAIWSNLGLTYLAHTHIPTVWSAQNVVLERKEWKRLANDTLSMERTLPNGVRFGAKVTPLKMGIKMELWLKNGTSATLTDLRIQNCVMLKQMRGFDAQTNENKRFESPFAICHDSSKTRWIVTAWEKCDRAWGNAPCPCLHSDPKFPDCAPGETVRLRGYLVFVQGSEKELQSAMQRLARNL